VPVRRALVKPGAAWRARRAFPEPIRFSAFAVANPAAEPLFRLQRASALSFLSNHDRGGIVAARLAWLVMTLVLGVGGAQAQTLDRVRENGVVTCGVAPDKPGFSASDGAGGWSGLYTDFCRAIAAAVFADPAKVSFIPVSGKEGFAALRAGRIDVLADHTTWTLARDAGDGARFAGALYYEGQGLMVPRRLGVTTVLELSGAEICVAEGSAAAMHVADYFRRQDMPHTLVTFGGAGDALHAYEAGRCDAFGGDLAELQSRRGQLARPEAHLILSDIVGVEPAGPAVRRDDPQWTGIVRWTLFALIGAEELQLTSESIADAATASSPLVGRFAGIDGALGERLGLDNAWAYNIVRMVGNYRELFARNLGEDSALDRDRRLNRLWRDGGMLSAPPLR